MAAVVVKPFVKLRAAFAERQTAAMAGAPGAMVRNAPMVPAFAAKSVEFMMWRPGRTVGREDIRPASFMKATIEPVKVMPPVESSAHIAFQSQQPVHTYQNTQISSDHVQGRDIRDVCHDTANANHNGSQTDDRM